MQQEVPISVIIPAFNEEKYIGDVLESLQKQTFKDFEIIVSDNDSTDKTKEISSRFPRVRVVTEKRRGISRNRNTGARAARGRLLVFLDADTVPSEHLLEAYERSMRDDGVVAATGPIYPLEKTSRRVSLGFKFVSVLFVKSSILLGRPSVVGLNFAVKKSAFDKIGGFNEDYATYEDWDLSLRLRKHGRIKYVDDAVVHTSTRRINAWGVSGFFGYHVGNIARYHLLKKPKEHYEPIR